MNDKYVVIDEKYLTNLKRENILNSSNSRLISKDENLYKIRTSLYELLDKNKFHEKTLNELLASGLGIYVMTPRDPRMNINKQTVFNGIDDLHIVIDTNKSNTFILMIDESTARKLERNNTIHIEPLTKRLYTQLGINNPEILELLEGEKKENIVDSSCIISYYRNNKVYNNIRDIYISEEKFTINGNTLSFGFSSHYSKHYSVGDIISNVVQKRYFYLDENIFLEEKHRFQLYDLLFGHKQYRNLLDMVKKYPFYDINPKIDKKEFISIYNNLEREGKESIKTFINFCNELHNWNSSDFGLYERYYTFEISFINRLDPELKDILYRFDLNIREVNSCVLELLRFYFHPLDEEQHNSVSLRNLSGIVDLLKYL